MKTAAYGVLGVVVCAALVVVFVLPPYLQDFVNRQGSSSLGRDFSLENLQVDWHWHTPSIHAENIRLENSEGTEEADMVHIKALDVDIRIWKLLYGKIELPRLEIDAPRIILERFDKDNANWNLPSFSQASVASEAAVPDDRGSVPDIGMLIVRGGTLRYRDAVKELDLDLKLDTVTAQGGAGDATEEQLAEKSAGQKLKLQGNGTMQGQPFTIDAEGGSVDMLRGDLSDFPLRLDVTMGETSVKVDGSFADPVKMEGVDARLDISGTNLADIYYLTGIPLPPTPAYSIEGHLGRKGDIWSFDDFKGKVGDSDLSGDLSYDTSDERGYVKADLHSSNMDMKDLGGFIGLSGKEKDEEQKSSDRLLPDVPLDLQRLNAADMDVTLRIDKLTAPGIPFNKMTMTFDLENGLLKIDPMKLSMADGTIEGELTLNGQSDIPAVKTDVDIKSLDMKRFFTGTRFEKLTGGHFGGHIELAGNGKSLADVLSSSDGTIVMLMDGGTISRLLIEASDLDIAEASPLLFGDDDATNIRCAVADLGVKDGILASRFVVFDTTDSTIKADVGINFPDETIDAEISAESKTPTLLALQSPITIKGPLKKPSVGIDMVESGARAAAATALGIVLTPVAAVLPFVELGLGKDSNCYGLIKAAQMDAGEEIEDEPGGN